MAQTRNLWLSATGSGEAEFDFDVSGLISTSDFSQVKPKFGNAVAECP